MALECRGDYEVLAPTPTLPRKRERGHTPEDFRFAEKSNVSDCGNRTIFRSVPPLPLAGEGWGGG